LNAVIRSKLTKKERKKERKKEENNEVKPPKKMMSKRQKVKIMFWLDYHLPASDQSV
jgi:hypothetical protein